MSLLEVLVFILIVGAGIFYIHNVFQKYYEVRLTQKIVSLEDCQKEFREQSEKFAYDKVRIADTTNILLALQDYNFDKGNLPSDLNELKKGEYFDGNLSDPELGRTYYYKKLSSVDYVLCVYLTTGTWGTNISQCPGKKEFLGEEEI